MANNLASYADAARHQRHGRWFLELHPLLQQEFAQGNQAMSKIENEQESYNSSQTAVHQREELNKSLFSQDLLRGADEIAEFLFGDRKQRRKIYHLAATSKYFPAFKLGSMLCARRSVLLKWIADQESRHADGRRQA